MSRQRRPGIAGVCAVLAALLPASADANPPDLYGYGARGAALAGAMTAAVDDSTANFYNPAALTRSGFLQIDIGYMVSSTSLRLNDADVGVDEGSGGQIGVVVPGDIGPVRVAFGLGIFLPQDRLSRVRALPQHQPRFVAYDNRPQRIFITTNVAVSPLPWLHLGAGVTFLTETRGKLVLDGLLFLGDAERSTLHGELDVRFETIRYPSAGILFTPSDSWSIGLTFRDEVAVELSLGASVDGAVVVGNQPFPGQLIIDSFNTNLFTPRQLWLGGTYRPISELLLSLDIGWLQWSRFPAPTARTLIDIEVEGLDLAQYIPPTTEVVEPDFHDIVSVRFGLEGSIELGRHAVLDLRGGYAYEPTPAPDQPEGTNFVDSDKHTIGYGVGITFRDWNPWVTAPVSVDLAGQIILLSEREYRKSDPTDIVGDYSADGELYTFTGTVRWRF